MSDNHPAAPPGEPYSPPLVLRPFSGLGRVLLRRLVSLEEVSRFGMRIAYWSVRRPWRPGLTVAQIYNIGNRSISIIVLAGLFTGMVMAYQTYYGFKFISVDSLVGTITALSMSKELAPVMTGLIVAGRAGSAMAARIGTMKVTEQVDALEAMGVNSIQYLVVPRVFASMVAVPMLSILFLFVGNLGSWVVGTFLLSIDEALYFSRLGEYMFVEDILQGVIKAFFFGLIISLVGTYQGLKVTNGAAGVGRGTNRSVVWGMILVLICDYFLTSFLTHLL